MTYLVEELIYAGVSADDPRVVAAIEWLKRHYTFAKPPAWVMPVYIIISIQLPSTSCARPESIYRR